MDVSLVPYGRFPVRTDVLTKAALHKAKQFYYIPYTDFKHNISVYLDDILQGLYLYLYLYITWQYALLCYRAT